MDLIDANHRDLASKLGQVLKEESFRGDVEDLYCLIFHCSKCLLLGLIVLVRVDLGSSDEVRQFTKLVGHQGNQWCHNQHETRHELSQVLVDERFTSTGREDNQSVRLLIEHNFDGL
jgi:hypothetical protein